MQPFAQSLVNEGGAEVQIQLELRAFPSEVKAGQSSGGRDDPPSNGVHIHDAVVTLWSFPGEHQKYHG